MWRPRASRARSVPTRRRAPTHSARRRRLSREVRTRCLRPGPSPRRSQPSTPTWSEPTPPWRLSWPLAIRLSSSSMRPRRRPPTPCARRSMRAWAGPTRTRRASAPRCARSARAAATTPAPSCRRLCPSSRSRACRCTAVGKRPGARPPTWPWRTPGPLRTSTWTMWRRLRQRRGIASLRPPPATRRASPSARRAAACATSGRRQSIARRAASAASA
mmetsp:Transcript_9309/g.27111  ORF Transcript_9309/g.27111 Transcript_9309/m.27111 type:complete len:217 (+) Transcript_9309:1014-1664(+)